MVGPPGDVMKGSSSSWTQVIPGSELGPAGTVGVLDAAGWQQRRQRMQKLGGPPLG